ncbi:MAG: hypothetical protein EZS28_032470, partial [Streblomastix strix]
FEAMENYKLAPMLLEQGGIDEDEHPHEIKTFNSLTGFGVVLNCIIGTGFFALPYGFQRSGLPLAIGFTLFAAMFSVLGAIFTLETMSRARGYEYAKERNIPHNSSMNKTTYKRYEMVIFAKTFGGLTGSIFVQIALVLYAFGALSAYISVFGSSLSNLIMRYIWQDPVDCVMEKDPSLNCQMMYSLCVFFFAVIVLILEIFELGNISFIQMFFTGYRILAFALIIISCIISLAYNGSYWVHPYISPSEIVPTEAQTHWYSFAMSGFNSLFSGAAFALNCAYNLPNALQSLNISRKRNSKGIVMAAIITSGSIYIIIASLIALTIGKDTLTFVILNWGRFGKHGFVPTGESGTVSEESWISVIIKLIVMLNPMMNQISVFPIIASSVGFSLYSFVPIKVRQALGTHVATLLFRYMASILPFIFALFIPKLGTIVEFAGLFAIFLVAIVPSVFQYLSKRKLGSEWKTPFSGWWSNNFFVLIDFIFGVVALIYLIYGFIRNRFK